MADRRVTYELYPTQKQRILLMKVRSLHQQLYNAALEQKRNAYRSQEISISYYNQAKQLTELRANDSLFKALNAQSSQNTLRRLDLAFDGFFRRAAAGETPGYPRFKSIDRYKGWGYPSHGDGWKLINDKPLKKKKMRNGKLYLQGIGYVKIRGASKHDGVPKTCDITFRGRRIYASVVIECTPSRVHGDKKRGHDWGTETFATLANEDGTFEYIDNPRNGRKVQDKIKKAHKELSRKKKGSQNRKKARKKLSKAYEKLKNTRKDFLHKETSKLVATTALLATEELNIQEMVKNSKNHGLNREVLDTAPGMFLLFYKYKAEEAGSLYREIETKRWMPTQTCSGCGQKVWKTLSDREHICPYCGLELGRDENSSRVCLNVVLYNKPVKDGHSARGREPTGCGGTSLEVPMKQESPSIASA